MTAPDKTFTDRNEFRSESELKSGFEILDSAFVELIGENPKIEKHWSGAEWSEGPVYVPSLKSCIWSDIPNNRMLRYEPETGETTVYREPSNYTNGNTLDLQGRMVTCEHQANRISRT